MMSIVFLLSITASMLSMQNRDDHSGSFLENVGTALPLADNKQGHTLLHVLAIKQEDTVLSYCIKNGAKIDILNKDQHTPLHLAVLCNHITTAKILLDNDADPNKENMLGLNCLDLAINMKNEALISLLKKRGAKESTTPDLKEIFISDKTLEYIIKKLPSNKQKEFFNLLKKANKNPKNTDAFFDLFTFCKRNSISISE